MIIELILFQIIMNLLHFDVEGGWGGSSNSLFELVKRLKIDGHKSYVICRKDSSS